MDNTILNKEHSLADTDTLQIVLRSSVGDDPFAGLDSKYSKDFKQFLSVAESQGGKSYALDSPRTAQKFKRSLNSLSRLPTTPSNFLRSLWSRGYMHGPGGEPR